MIQKKIVNYLFGSYSGLFFEADMDAAVTPKNAVLSKYTFSELTPGHFKNDTIFTEKNRRDRFLIRYDMGHRCYGFLKKNSSVASYYWLTLSDKIKTPPLALMTSFLLRPLDAYIWDCFTSADCRRLGLYKNGLLNARAEAFKRGARKTYIFCAADNTYSKAGILSAGFKKIFDFRGIRIGPVSFIKKSEEKAGLIIRTKLKAALKRRSCDIFEIGQDRRTPSNPELRIFIVGNKGYSTKILEHLLDRKERVVGICSKRDPNRLISLLKKNIQSLLLNLGIYQGDSFVYKNPFENFASPVKIASRKGIPVLRPERLYTAGFGSALRRLSPDLILVAGFHRLIPRSVIKSAGTAIINFHPSLLPRHRGGTPTRWAIRNGESESGVTAHLVDETFDTGDIVMQERIGVEPDDTWGRLEIRVADKIVDMLEPILRSAKGGRLKGSPQDPRYATHESSLTKTRQAIDWSESASAIKRLCRALRPKSSGLTTISGKKLCVWDIEPLKDVTHPQSAGTIADIDQKGCPVVYCGDGALKILSFLRSGNIVDAGRMVKKMRIKKGMVFK